MAKYYGFERRTFFSTEGSFGYRATGQVLYFLTSDNREHEIGDSSWKKGSLGRGLSGTSTQSFALCFPVFWGDFLLRISQQFPSEIAPPMQAFSGKPPREKPQNAAADIRLKFSIRAWKFQSRLKFAISLENFNPDLDNSPQQGPYFQPRWNFQSRLKISIWDWSLESFNPGAKSWIFSIFGPLGFCPLSWSNVSWENKSSGQTLRIFQGKK